jgi:5-formyltetrahydrofolate cyclo-ligase
MEEIQEKKQEIRSDVIKKTTAMPDETRKEKIRDIENRLFEFANFLEANIALLYINTDSEVATMDILERSFSYGKILVLPAFDMETFDMALMKIDNLNANLVPGPRGVLEPDPKHCKKVPMDCIDIAIIPGIAFDEKGARIGTGAGFYDRLIPDLPITTRKVALSLEDQIVPQIPMESHDRHVDIIVTDQRIIYKI